MVEVENELERLTESLFFRRTASRPKSLLMADLGVGDSSVWVARGVAAALSKSIGERVYVLSLNSHSDGASSAKHEPVSDQDGYSFQTIFNSRTSGGQAHLVRDKVTSLLAQGNTVIVHVSEDAEEHLSFPHLNLMDGVVLLVRAAQTQRMALHAIQNQLASDGPVLLGSVLLDCT